MRAFLLTLDRALDRLYTGCGYVGAVFMVALATCVFLSIATRQMGLYIAGLTEYSGYSMAAASFFALAYTFRSGGHIRVALVRSRLGPKGRLALELWCLAVASLLTGFMAYYLVRMAYISWIFGEKSEGGAATPLWIPQTAVAIGAVVMAIAAVHALILTIVRPDPDAPWTGRPGVQME